MADKLDAGAKVPTLELDPVDGGTTGAASSSVRSSILNRDGIVLSATYGRGPVGRLDQAERALTREDSRSASCPGLDTFPAT